MKIVIIDYNGGNIYSVLAAIRRLGYEAALTDNPDKILAADRVIFPGVGEASTTMQILKKLELVECIRNVQRPLLGICLGMQLLCKSTEENNTPGIGIFDLTVQQFVAKQEGQKIPHMGWNRLVNLKSKLFNNSLENRHCYFVHSYFVPLSEYTIATANYIQPFSAAIQKDNFYATQFHPEKSGAIGEQILNQFLAV